MENKNRTVQDPTREGSFGRLLLDASAEAVLNTFFFFLRFFGWVIQWSVATVVMLLVMAGAGFFVFTEALEGGKHVTVPDITGLPVTEASIRLGELDLELGEYTPVPHSTVPKYHVITQRPESGRVVRTGRRVSPTVSMGEDFLTTPLLVKMKIDEARKVIDQSRFRIGTVARIPNAAQRDTVLAQDPAPGRSLANMAGINILVSAGSAQASAMMPDIRGKAIDEVLALLSPYGVTVMPYEVDTPGVAVDVVLNQDPPPGTQIFEGQIITYEVKPSGSKEVPDTRYQAEIRHTFYEAWYGKEIRVDLVDGRGNRTTLQTIPTAFDANAQATRVAGGSIRINANYVNEAVLEVYTDNQLTESYYLKNGKAPSRQPIVN